MRISRSMAARGRVAALLLAVPALCQDDSVTPQSSGLLAHWSMDAVDGAVVRDVTGNGHDATFLSRPAGVKLQVLPGLPGNGNAVRFDEASGTYLAAGKPEDFNFGTAFTVMAWVKPSARMRRRTGEILCKGYDRNERGQAPWHGWRLRCGWGMFFFRYVSESGQQQVQYRTPGGTAPPGSWSHIAVTFDRGDLRAYVSSVQKVAVQAPAGVAPSPCPLVIGNYVGSKSPYAFDGMLASTVAWSVCPSGRRAGPRTGREYLGSCRA